MQGCDHFQGDTWKYDRAGVLESFTLLEGERIASPSCTSKVFGKVIFAGYPTKRTTKRYWRPMQFGGSGTMGFLVESAASFTRLPQELEGFVGELLPGIEMLAGFLWTIDSIEGVENL